MVRRVARWIITPAVRRALRDLGWRVYWAGIYPVARRVRLVLGPYSGNDLSNLWKQRASRPGQTGVMWQNDEWNMLYRGEQEKVLRSLMEALPRKARVLDICCGVGTVSGMMRRLNSQVEIDGVDFEEMISIARTLVPEGVRFITSPAEDYLTDTAYDLVVSSSALSVIKDATKMLRTIRNCAQMTKPGGTILMIDPWHRWRYLARARYSSRQICEIMAGVGFKLSWRSGIIFWPYRDWLANSNLAGETLKRRFEQGEKLLNLLGRNLWSDYKVLVFRKQQP